MIFDTLFPDDLEFQSVKGTTLESITPEGCEIFSNLYLKSNTYDGFNKQVSLGISDGFLIMFFKKAARDEGNTSSSP